MGFKTGKRLNCHGSPFDSTGGMICAGNTFLRADQFFRNPSPFIARPPRDPARVELPA